MGERTKKRKNSYFSEQCQQTILSHDNADNDDVCECTHKKSTMKIINDKISEIVSIACTR